MTRSAVAARVLAAAFLAVTVCVAQAQSPVKYAAGQDVSPAFEGWVPNADGSFLMVFGYFNRNWEEDLAVPVGPDNNIEPGGPDRGQPTYFYTRRNKFSFAVTVPKDWGKQDLVWTLTTNGRTSKAYGSLLPAYEMTARNFQSGGNFSVEPSNDDVNQPPAITVNPTAAVALSTALTLNATVTDDGLPKPRKGRGAAASGLRVSWIEFRGPRLVTIVPSGFTAAAGGRSSAKATFTVPGTYVLRAIATDGALRAVADVTVTVAPPAGR